MKKNKRVGAIIAELISNPQKTYSMKFFCDLFDVAKSSISEDVKIANEILQEMNGGHIETVPGTGGGMKYVPGISDEERNSVQKALCLKLEDPKRILGGGFLYTSDMMFDGTLIRDMARIFLREFGDLPVDYIATVETKGIPLASMVAFMMNIPLVVIRREARYSEGSTVSINYFSGSYDRIQKMSISKRAVTPNAKAIIIDDFMRGGGSLKGLTEILSEFDIEVLMTGVAIVSKEPKKKKIDSYFPIVYLDKIDEENKRIITSINKQLRP